MVAKSSTVKGCKNPFASDARKAGLRYTSDLQPGITRLRQGKAFIYIDPSRSRIKDQRTLVRIKRLAIPPAWENVWISPDEHGHIQATGRDARGRKQYRYHPEWRQQRDENKFARMSAFARALPRIRKRVDRDLRRRGIPRDKVLATVVRLLEATLIRVGNDEYARDNDSFGLTTMRDGHARIRGAQIHFSFRGKSARKHEISIRDPKLARIVRRCQEMPGQELFAYMDEDGRARDVTSQDVNTYLRAISGGVFTAKDFRTWAGTLLTAIALKACARVSHQREARKNIVAAIEAVAKMLGNTPSVCKKCYIHPGVIDSYLAGHTIGAFRRRKRAATSVRLKPEETAVLALIHPQRNAFRPG